MNLSLVDPFVLAQDYPDTLTEKLSMSSTADMARFFADHPRKWTCNLSTVQPQRRLSSVWTGWFSNIKTELLTGQINNGVLG